MSLSAAHRSSLRRVLRGFRASVRDMKGAPGSVGTWQRHVVNQVRAGGSAVEKFGGEVSLLQDSLAEYRRLQWLDTREDDTTLSTEEKARRTAQRVGLAIPEDSPGFLRREDEGEAPPLVVGGNHSGNFGIDQQQEDK